MRRRVAFSVAAFVVVASGTALAATQLVGRPVVPGPRVLGGPRMGSIELTAVRVSDPDGGPPWGIRIYRPLRTQTSAGAPTRVVVTCAQIGRVVGGALGVLGRDGAFNDDRLFHPLPVEPTTTCVRALDFVSFPGLIPASGYIGPGSCPPTSDRTDGRAVQEHQGRAEPRCPGRDLRLVVFGVVQTSAPIVRLLGSGWKRTQRLVAADHGAFLFVLRPSAQPHANGTHLRISVGK